ncbi:hypothetical protein N8K70_03875 [Microbacterium betulae]|uniref:HNH endonuclease n=1 Tax=Microbacterium betulae TaxID=2981139 RepID=A0AA97FKM3_9MICO|nr:hypothetical protein [Microbacterium sp. AB]WOF23829.1 hypothetical protein N8K70_03875 [Microbacterium sp. AB]
MTDSPYGWEHQKRRAELLPLAYNTPCPRCGNIMLETDDLDLGHTVDHAIDPHSVGDRIEHADCNRSAGGTLGAMLRSHKERFRPSRAW